MVIDDYNGGYNGEYNGEYNGDQWMDLLSSGEWSGSRFGAGPYSYSPAPWEPVGATDNFPTIDSHQYSIIYGKPTNTPSHGRIKQIIPFLLAY